MNSTQGFGWRKERSRWTTSNASIRKLRNSFLHFIVYSLSQPTLFGWFLLINTDPFGAGHLFNGKHFVVVVVVVY